MKNSKWVTAISLCLVLFVIVLGIASLSNFMNDVGSSILVENNSFGGNNTGGNNTGGDITGDDNTGGDNTGGDNTSGDNTSSDNTGSDNTGNDIIANNFMLDFSPEFYYGYNQESELECGINFIVGISSEVKEVIVEGGEGELKWLYLPLDQYESAGLMSRAYDPHFDLISFLDAADVDYEIAEDRDYVFNEQFENGLWKVSYPMCDITYEDINRSFVSFVYYETEGGNRVFSGYAYSFETDCIPFGYLCVEAFNDQIRGSVEYPADVDAALTEYIRLSAGQNYGYEKESDVPADMMYLPLIVEDDGNYQNREIVLYLAGSTSEKYYMRDLIVGCTEGFEVTFDMPLVHYSTDSAIAAADGVGNNVFILAQAPGTCKVWIHCGTGVACVDVTVV